MSNEGPAPDKRTRREVLQRGSALALGASGAAAVLAACGSSAKTPTIKHAAATHSPSPGSSQGVIPIGVLFSLSGDLSIAEVPMHNATMMAISEINAAGGVGGRKLEPVVADYASDFSLVVQKAKQLVQQRNVAAVVGCYSSASRKAVLPVFEGLNNCLIYPTFYEGLECSTNVIYSSLVANQAVFGVSDWMVQHLGKKIYMVGSNYVGPQTYNAIAEKVVTSKGATVIANRFFPLTQTDFGAALSDIKAANPDVIWNTIVGAGIPAFYKQWAQAGFTSDKTPIVTGIATEQEIKAVGGEIAKGSYFASSYFETMKSPNNSSFIERYKAKYGSSEPTNEVMQASYNSVYLLKAAIEKAGEATPRAILKAFPGVTTTPPGLEGPVTVKANNHTTHKVFLGRANGKALYDVIADFGEIDPEPFPSQILPASKIPQCPRRETRA